MEISSVVLLRRSRSEMGVLLLGILLSEEMGMEVGVEREGEVLEEVEDDLFEEEREEVRVVDEVRVDEQDEEDYEGWV